MALAQRLSERLSSSRPPQTRKPRNPGKSARARSCNPVGDESFDSKLAKASAMSARLLAGALLVCSLARSMSIGQGPGSDDPKNFQRAWGQPAPSDLQIRHSWDWRSAHFTREEAYYFQFARHDALMRGFIAETGFNRSRIRAP